MWWDHPEGPMVEADIDVIVLRSGLSVQLDRADRFAARGLPVFNDPGAHRQAQDKHFQAAAFLRAGVPHPATKGVGAGLPSARGALVAKPRYGSSGERVRLINVADVEQALATGGVVQERIVDAEEFRATVVGQRVVAWARKIPAEGEFRANLALGARMFPTTAPDAESADVAVRAVEALGLDIGGVDLMVGRSGPVVLEVNAATTLYGADGASTAQILSAIIELCAAAVSDG